MPSFLFELGGPCTILSRAGFVNCFVLPGAIFFPAGRQLPGSKLRSVSPWVKEGGKLPDCSLRVNEYFKIVLYLY